MAPPNRSWQLRTAAALCHTLSLEKGNTLGDRDTERSDSGSSNLRGVRGAHPTVLFARRLGGAGKALRGRGWNGSLGRWSRASDLHRCQEKQNVVGSVYIAPSQPSLGAVTVHPARR